MKINSSTNFTPKFTSAADSKPEQAPAQTQTAISAQNPSKKIGLLDKFETGMKNSADMNDTVQVPRTIFKGYLAFFAGTSLTAVAAIAKKHLPKVANTFNVLAALLVTYGTYSFVRPYLINGPTDSKAPKA